MKLIYTAVNVFAAFLLCSTAAHAVSLTGTMLIDRGIRTSDVNGVYTYVSGSYFAMFADAPNDPSFAAMLTPGSAGGIVLGTHQNFVLDPNTPHPDNWDGMGGGAGSGYGVTATTISTMVKPFFFFGNRTYVGTNPIAYQSGMAHPASTADISNCVGNSCTLSMELSAWEVMWNGSAFQQGPRPVNTDPFVTAIGTYDLSTQAYSITWASQIKGGGFNGVTGYWHLEGTVVPIPAAVWLLGSGLLGLFGMARGKKEVIA